MGFKGVYENKSLASKVGILFLLIFLSVILHNLIAVALVSIFFENGIELIQNYDLSRQESVNYLKIIQLFSGVGFFIVPTLFYSYLTNFDFKFTRISRQNTILVIAIMMLITPFIALLLEWNMMIDFPQWLLQFDINSEAIVTAFLKMDTIWDLFFTILVLAIVPAVGEELLFRGYIQQRIARSLGSQHTSILITAFLFSAIHLHFQGMIPRFLLGLLLGYLFYWSRSLWIPILAHFVNNAQAVVFSYPSFKIDSAAYSVSPESSVEPMMGLFSFLAVTLLLYLFYQNTTIKKG
tara:strand:- start:2039 stop:2920 length:882 start_codon:yes stop_codon:yes gene_type:complete